MQVVKPVFNGAELVHMKCHCRLALKVGIFILVVIGLAMPVEAQGQTPTSPTTTPPTARQSSSISASSSSSSNNSATSAQKESPLSRRLKRRNSSSSSSDTTSQGSTKSGLAKGLENLLGGGDSKSTASGDTKGAGESTSGKKTTSGSNVIGGKSSSSSGARAIGASGSGDGGAARMTAGGAATVSVKGNATFEPAYEHEVVYGDVPDVGDKMTLEEGQMAIEEFLHTIYMATGWNILMSDAVKGTQLKFWLSDKTPKEALEVLKFHSIYYEFNPQTKYLYVMTQDEWLQREFGAKHPHEFIVRHADISYIESILSSLMSSEGRMITDQRTPTYLRMGYAGQS